jgi:hypothetical protein
MPCILTIIALAFPRIVLFLVFLLSNYLGRAYQTVLWPFLGFFLMPLTTLAYAWAINSAGSVQGIYLVAVVIAVLIDLGLIGSGEHSRRHRAG